MDEKGQAEAVFRLMIDSIIGLAILLIIISLVYYFNGLVIEQSRTDFINNLRDAVGTPDGTIVASDELTFAEGFAVTQQNCQTWTGHGAQCFEFNSRPGAVKIVTGSDGESAGATVTQMLKTQVYMQCNPSPNPENCDPKLEPETKQDCCFTCLISFGKKIE